MHLMHGKFFLKLDLPPISHTPVMSSTSNVKIFEDKKRTPAVDYTIINVN